jgi:predicted RNA-binding Zn ribbon-like protein
MLHPEPMMTGENPLFELTLIGGRLSLDFLNTADTHDPLAGDMLHGYSDLLWWALRVGVMDDSAATALFAAAEADPARARQVLAAAVTLREALYRVFVAARGGTTADAADLDVLNAALSSALAHLRVAGEADGFGWAWEEGAQLERVLWPVARDAAELLVSGDLRRVGKCCGENCDWLYLDTSRNRSRRWCDMQSCGNRAKARRHYHRAKSK